MNPVEKPKVESEALGDFLKVMQRKSPAMSGHSDEDCLPSPLAGQRRRLNIDQDNVKNGLGQLVLTLVKLLHELLERQAIRRIDAGSLSDDEIERIGVTLMRQVEEIERLRKEFGLEEDELNIDLGPLGKLL